jgi:hypothetical protein
MRRMTEVEIRDEFNAQKTRFENDHAKSGLLEALENLSHCLADIKAQGYDVSLEIFGNPSEQAFAMFPRGGGLTTPVSGILKSGTNHRLLAFSTKVGGQPALQLAVSEFDIRHHGMDGKLKLSGDRESMTGETENSVRAKIYDLKKDPEAMVKFQKDVLFHCARNEAVNARDVAGAFDNGQSLRKLKAPSLKS